MAKPHSIKFQINTKFLVRIFSKIKVSTENFYKGVPCWEWQGATNQRGYAEIAHNRPASYGKRITIPVHRLVYEHFVADVPSDIVCDHLCRVRHCINPCHIEPVMQGINALRGEGICAKNARRTHCKNGHEFVKENLLPNKINPKYRVCKTCAYIRTKRALESIMALPFDHPKRVAYRLTKHGKKPK